VSDDRLATAIEVSALLAQVHAAGGYGAVLQRGDAERGSLLIVVAERGAPHSLLERLLQQDGRYAWETRETEDSSALQQHLERATHRDPDLWVIELDVPSAERFIAGMTSGD
jgi:hypothetical protein